MLTFAKYMELYVVLGLISGIAAVVMTAFGVKRLGRKISLRTLFCITMGVGAYMSITFIGNAVRELQVVDYLPATNLAGIVPRLDISLASMTGIHPALETIVAQVILLIIYLAGSMYFLIYQPSLRKKIEISRKTISDFRKKQDNQDQTPN